MFTLHCRPSRTVGAAALIAAALSMSSPMAAPAPTYESLLERLDVLPSAREATALFEAAEARSAQSRARPNPTLSLEVDNAWGDAPYTRLDAAETTLSISQPLELWGQRKARIGVALAELDAAGLRRAQQRWQVAARLAAAYVEAEAATLRHALALEALSLTEEDAHAVTALVDEGREPMLRRVQAKSEVELARAASEAARAGRDAALARLSALTLLDTPITTIEPDLLDRTPGTQPFAAADALAIQMAEADVSTAERLVDLAQRNARPDLSASLGVRRFRETGDQAMTLGISLPLPVFDRQRGAIRAAHAEQRAAEARLDAQRLEIGAERLAIQAALAASNSHVRAADSSVAAAEEAYRLARIGVDAGRISQLELRSGRAGLIAARETRVEARLARARAEIDLAALEGRLPFGDTP